MASKKSGKVFTTELKQRPMTLRIYPDTVLRQVADQVTVFDKPLRGFAETMLSFMIENKGIGLAAPQVGVLYRIITVGLREVHCCLINPEIISVSFDNDTKEEGCLSLPDKTYEVNRNISIEVRARNIDGGITHFEAKHLFARVVQHEIDHLNGVLICDKGSVVC
jgi:peptide deformylase